MRIIPLTIWEDGWPHKYEVITNLSRKMQYQLMQCVFSSFTPAEITEWEQDMKEHKARINASKEEAVN